MKFGINKLDEPGTPSTPAADASDPGVAFSAFQMTDGTVRTAPEDENPEQLEKAWKDLIMEGQARKAAASVRKSLSPMEIEALARQVFEEHQHRREGQGSRLPGAFLTRLIGELSGLGSLLTLIARPDVEDIAVNLQHVYIYTTENGWRFTHKAPEGLGEAIRVLMDRAGQRTPTPDYPIADAMLQVMVPTDDAVIRCGLRVNYIMPPASPYGDLITLRVGRYANGKAPGLARLCEARLPPVPRPAFKQRPFPHGNGLLTPAAANYLLSVMVNGGTIVIAGATGSGKTYFAQQVLQETLDFFPPGRIRLFVIEDANELVLNGWSGDPQSDTGNIIYTVTRSEVRGGAPPVTMYDLIRAALRARPHGIIIGESRGAEAWELVRAAATGHGYSAFTLHATSAEQVWARFFQIVQTHPDARRMGDYQIAKSFAEAVCAVVYIERNSNEGQVIREIAEVSTVVERAAGRPAFSSLFYRARDSNLLPTGNRPSRIGFRPDELNLPETIFQRK